MAEEIQKAEVEQLADYLASLSQPLPLEFGERVQRAVVLREATRLRRHLKAFDSGEFDWMSLAEVWELIKVARASASIRSAAIVLHCDRLRELDEAAAQTAIETVASWVDASTPGFRASLLLSFESEMELTTDPAALRLALAARLRGWQVASGAVLADSPLVRVELRTETGDSVSLTATESPEGLSCAISFGAVDSTEAAKELDWAAMARSWRQVEVPETGVGAAGESVAEEVAVTVADLFGERIMLRDLEPRGGGLDGIESFRKELGWDETYVPRKNEPEYGHALLRIIGSARGSAPARIVYVGDTLLNDGGAIRGLQAVGPQGSVWGFLCGATKAPLERDLVLDRIYFGSEWASLRQFIDYARQDGLVLDEDTWVLFDLDQTVYAAKGRDDEALMRARWDGIQGYLESIIPDYKFDPGRAEALYREFDRDDYHPVTRDNLDYVVLLVMAVASGLADATEIRDYATSARPSIGTLAEELRQRAAMRLGHEDVGAVLNAIKTVNYNNAVGDPTPCKDFRRYECLGMAARMRGDAGRERGERIVINREVADLIALVGDTPANLFAVSDRPLEAAVAEFDEEAIAPVDLMRTPMALSGTPIREWGQ